MSDLVEWLRQQLDDDERIALAATAGPWRVDDVSYAETIYSADYRAVVAGGRWGGEGSVFDDTADAIHIVRHDPARVLAEVDAKRRILDLHSPHQGGACPVCWRVTPMSSRREDYPCPTIRALALPYAGRDGYRDEWRPQ